MTVHLIKLCAGASSLHDLAQWQRQQPRSELMHVTKHMPKRADELLQGGSLYWVIKSMIVARQKMIELRPITIDGISYCGLVYDPEIITVQPRPRRPFQGWRYLDPADAPADIAPYRFGEEIDNALEMELMALGLV
jgi:hypothetical protein